MDAQTILTPSGERLIVLPESEYNRLVDVAEDAADREALGIFRARLAAGEEEFLPASLANRIVDGESRIKVWREHRSLSATELAAAAGIAQSFLSQIESGHREGRIDTLRRIARALSVTLDDLAG